MSRTADTWQQYRRVTIASGPELVHDGYGGSIDLDLRLIHSKDEGLTFEAGMWNLAPDTWRSISEGDTCRISLGWDGGKINHVMLGIINKKYPIPEGRDIRYVIKGIDESEAMTREHISKTWRDRSPSEIVQSIARELGMTPGRIDPSGGVLEGCYAIKDDEPVSYWLDQLSAEAEKITETQWEWYCQTGQLYFERKDQETVQATILSYDNTLLSISESAGQSDKEDAADDLEFEALCEPDIAKNSLVAVDTDRFKGVYKVLDYQFTSNSINGDHNVRGTITPVGSQYEWSRLSTGGGRPGGGRVV